MAVKQSRETMVGGKPLKTRRKAAEPSGMLKPLRCKGLRRISASESRGVECLAKSAAALVAQGFSSHPGGSTPVNLIRKHP